LVKYSIIIPTYTHPVGELLESIVKFTDMDNTEIIVVANGCSSEKLTDIYSFKDAHKNVYVRLFNEGIGYPAAVNAGIKSSFGEFIIPLNDDCVLLPQEKNKWLDVLAAPFSDPRMAATGPYMNWSEAAEYWFLIFFCVMLRKSALDNVGLLDEFLYPGYGEDTDLCIRLKRAGWKIAQVPTDARPDLNHDIKCAIGDFPIFHAAEGTFKNDPNFGNSLEVNNKKLRERYGTKIEKAMALDGWISDVEAKKIASRARDAKVIIEVGSWHGKSTRALADNTPGKVYAIDHWLGSKAEPGTHASAMRLDGDHAFLEFQKNLFDHITSGKVLPLRMSSLNAAGLLREKGIKADMIFIDGGHEYEEVAADIRAYLPLLSESGIICGHDYSTWPGVTKAVDEVFGPQKVGRDDSVWMAENASRPRIFDGFMFFNEFDILELRLSALYDVVEKFIIVERNITHQGKPKPYHLDDEKVLRRYEKWWDKVVYVKMASSPADEDDPWARERAQRDYIGNGFMLAGAKDGDAVCVSDCDEIPNPETLKNYRLQQGFIRYEMDFYYYYLNMRSVQKWDWFKILPYSLFRRLPGACYVRYAHTPDAGTSQINNPLIPNGGWHFSYCTGNDPLAVIEKIRAFAHSEYNTPEITSQASVKNHLDAGTDVFQRPGQEFHPCAVDDSFPQPIKENRRRWESLFYPVKRKRHVLCFIPTRNRYASTLPLTLISIAGQTRPPDHVIIWDDGDRLDIRTMPLYQHILGLFAEKKILWQVLFGQGKGPAFAHQASQDVASDLIWRIDDDEIAEPNVLEELLKGFSSEAVGAVAGIVAPPPLIPLPQGAKNSISDVNAPNIQWFSWGGPPRSAEHLHSSFLYRKGLASYDTRLSPAGHREETLFTHEIFRKGWKLLVTPSAVTWHFRNPEGGLRSHADPSFWERDECVFAEKMEEWGHVFSSPMFAYLDCGLGDHIVFLEVAKEFQNRGRKNIIVGACYPEVFEGMEGVSVLSLDTFRKNYPSVDVGNLHVYKFMADCGWKKSMTEAFLELYASPSKAGKEPA
jgi:beta-1,4-mannosyl-glycoprotein beta-1,4-N-acetylglucosaminyltransferase